jgi:formylglycine-generating enzyme required for sulfatase activity
MRISSIMTPLLLITVLVGCATPQQPPAAQPDAQVQSASPATFRDCANCPELVPIPAGRFTIGSPQNEADRQADEGPQHAVTIAKPIAVGAFEITYGQYARFAAATRRGEQDWKIRDQSLSESEAALYPVAWVSWQDAKDYAAWLSQETGRHYRLLTEAEWEYVARAGTDSPRERVEARDAQRRPVQEQAHFTFPVGSFKPNAFGVYDLTSNIPEWVEDCYRDSYAGAPSDGTAVEGECRQRVVRGTYNGYDELFKAFRRVANRDWGYAVNRSTGNPTGFRVARDMP